jgi:hypothetical protein
VAERPLRFSRRKLAVIGVGLVAAVAGFAIAVLVPSHGSDAGDRLGMIAPLFMIAAAVMVALQRRRSDEDTNG